MMIFLEILFGFLGGIFGGMGMGGGTLLIPLLTIFLSFNQSTSQGINLLSFLSLAIIALIIHYKNNLLVLNDTWKIMIGGVLFSIISALIANFLPDKILKSIFGVFLIILGIYQFSMIFVKKKKK